MRISFVILCGLSLLFWGVLEGQEMLELGEDFSLEAGVLQISGRVLEVREGPVLRYGEKTRLSAGSLRIILEYDLFDREAKRLRFSKPIMIEAEGGLKGIWGDFIEVEGEKLVCDFQKKTVIVSGNVKVIDRRVKRVFFSDKVVINYEEGSFEALGSVKIESLE